MTAIDLGERMGQAEAQDLLPMLAGANYIAAADIQGVTRRCLPRLLLLDLMDELDDSPIMIPVHAKDPR